MPVASTPVTASTATSSTPASTTTTPSVAADLTRPRQARQAVDLLVAAAGLPAIKLDVSATQATLSTLDGTTPRAWRWVDGRVNEVESDIEYIQQATFNPDDFNIDDVGALFATAAQISGSSSSQELQIVEQTPGTVLMVVGTRPESEPVFFRPDGSTVNRLDLTTKQGLDEALRDVIAGRTQLTVVGATKDLVYAESTDPKAAGATLRISRPRRVPAFRTSRQEAPTLNPFGPSDIHTQVIVDTCQSMRARWGKPADAVVTWVMDRRDNRPLPTIRFMLEDKTMVTDLTGRDITHEV